MTERGSRVNCFSYNTFHFERSTQQLKRKERRAGNENKQTHGEERDHDNQRRSAPPPAPQQTGNIHLRSSACSRPPSHRRCPRRTHLPPPRPRRCSREVSCPGEREDNQWSQRLLPSLSFVTTTAISVILIMSLIVPWGWGWEVRGRHASTSGGQVRQLPSQPSARYVLATCLLQASVVTKSSLTSMPHSNLLLYCHCPKSFQVERVFTSTMVLLEVWGLSCLFPDIETMTCGT